MRPVGGRLQQRLQARAQHRGARQRAVGEERRDLPALPLRPLAAEPLLVLDRGLPLHVRREPRVDRRAHQPLPFLSRATSAE